MADTAEGNPKPHGLSGLIARLRDNARAFVRAEVQYVIAELGVRSSAALPALIMVVIAVALSFSALTAVLIGLIIALAPYLTIWGSLALVASLSVLIAFLLVRQAVSIIRIVREPKDESYETDA